MGGASKSVFLARANSFMFLLASVAQTGHFSF